MRSFNLTDQEIRRTKLMRELTPEQLEMTDRLIDKLHEHACVPVAIVVPDPVYHANVIPLR